MEPDLTHLLLPLKANDATVQVDLKPPPVVRKPDHLTGIRAVPARELELTSLNIGAHKSRVDIRIGGCSTKRLSAGRSTVHPSRPTRWWDRRQRPNRDSFRPQLDQRRTPTHFSGSPRPNPNARLGLRDPQRAEVQCPGSLRRARVRAKEGRRRRHLRASRVKNAAARARRPPTTESEVPVIACYQFVPARQYQ